MPHQRTEILGMLAAGRSGADVARLFRVHRATIGRIAAEARAMVAEATPALSTPRFRDFCIYNYKHSRETKKLNHKLYQSMVARARRLQRIEITRFPERHFGTEVTTRPRRRAFALFAPQSTRCPQMNSASTLWLLPGLALNRR